MGFWPAALLIFGVSLLIGLAMPRKGPAKGHGSDAAPEEEELWTPDALARLGTPETAADLAAEGRSDELRGLGYTGDLPPDC
jgi:hypothetical protein